MAIFREWFSFDGFNVWKLRTGWDYLYFLALVAAGVVIFTLINRNIRRGRTPEKATARTAAKMKALGGAGAVCYTDRTVHHKQESRHCDLICVAKDRVYAVKVYHYGLDIDGSAGDRKWQLRCGKDVETTDNPQPSLNEQRAILTRLFAGSGMNNVPVETLIVFADNFGTVHLHLKGVKNAVTLRQLKEWRKANPLKGTPIQTKKVCEVLEQSFREG